ncbi:MAG TPA: hypothetical protein VMS17_15225 [Gemmataceae bacterium]|nr:hypothetical protein [Gemmataceae bacterium]
MSAEAWAEWRRQRLSELPHGIPTEYFGEMCQALVRYSPWGCEGGRHALVAAIDWIRRTEYAAYQAEVLAWAESLGGVCDCTIRDRLYRRLRRLSEAQENRGAKQ